MSRNSVDATRKAWRNRFQRFAKSGLPVARFCSREGVSVASFYYWRKKVVPNGARRRPAGRRGAFRVVKVVPPAPGVSIHLACGTRIEVRAEDLDAVRAVVAELARADRGLENEGASC
jgi:hypothetical protein